MKITFEKAVEKQKPAKVNKRPYIRHSIAYCLDGTAHISNIKLYLN